MEQKIISPCINICKTDPLTGFCYGCGRTDEEISIWKDPETDNIWKKKQLVSIKERLSGWQKDAFEKSYLSKKEIGMSLIKRKLIELKN